MKRNLVLINLITVVIFVFIQSCGEHTRRSHEESYKTIEQQEVTLTYLIKDKCIYHHRTDGAVLFGDNPKMKVYCTVTNTSDYNGTFKLYATMSSQGQTLNFEDEEYIASGEAKELSQEYEINPYSFETNVKMDDWKIEAPTMTVDKEVIKYRTVYDE